jgi:hypothetical protein
MRTRLAMTILPTGIRWAMSHGGMSAPDKGFEPCTQDDVHEVIDRLILDYGPDHIDVELG